MEKQRGVREGTTVGRTSDEIKRYLSLRLGVVRSHFGVTENDENLTTPITYVVFYSSFSNSDFYIHMDPAT